MRVATQVAAIVATATSSPSQEAAHQGARPATTSVTTAESVNALATPSRRRPRSLSREARAIQPSDVVAPATTTTGTQGPQTKGNAAASPSRSAVRRFGTGAIQRGEASLDIGSPSSPPIREEAVSLP
jgi:hypothetical protein